MSDHPRDELDMRDGESRQALSRALTEGWDVPVDVRRRAIRQCSELLELAAEEKQVRDFRVLLRLLIEANAQDQAAAMHRDRMDAAAAGTPLDGGGVTVIFRELPSGDDDRPRPASEAG